MTKLTEQEALICVMVVTSAADHTMTEKEIEQLGHLVSLLPVFDAFDGDVAKIAESAATRLADPDGLDSILDDVVASLPARLYETAYALAVEVAAADLAVKQEELVLLQILEDRFELPKLAVAAIEHSARVRYRKAS